MDFFQVEVIINVFVCQLFPPYLTLLFQRRGGGVICRRQNPTSTEVRFFEAYGIS